MKHNFNYPQYTTVDTPSGLPCDCMDCQKGDAYSRQLQDRNAVYNNAFDFPSNPTAADYIGASLVAAKPVTVYKSGQPIATVKEGGQIGTVSSWLSNPPRFLLTSGATVNIEPGAFDQKAALASLELNAAQAQARIDKRADARKEANTSPLYQAGKAVNEAASELGNLFSFGTLKWIIASLVVAIVAGLFLRARG